MNDSVFRALADPTRRRILKLLARRDRTAGEIAEEFPMTFASVSHHLAVLKSADLVGAAREGRFVRYHLDATTVRETVRYLADFLPGGRRA